MNRINCNYWSVYIIKWCCTKTIQSVWFHNVLLLCWPMLLWMHWPKDWDWHLGHHWCCAQCGLYHFLGIDCRDWRPPNLEHLANCSWCTVGHWHSYEKSQFLSDNFLANHYDDWNHSLVLLLATHSHSGEFVLTIWLLAKNIWIFNKKFTRSEKTR